MRTTDIRFVSAPDATPAKGLRFFALVRAGLTARRQRRALLALDDRMLADIGISRSQACGEADRAFFDLPKSQAGRRKA